MKSIAVNGVEDGPDSLSTIPLSMSTFRAILALFAIASPTPRRMIEGMMDVYNEPMLYMIHLAFASASMIFGLAAGLISWP